MTEELTIDPAISSAMQELGIPQSRMDDGETPTVEAEDKEVEAQPEESIEQEASEENGDLKEEGEEAQATTEGEVTEEVPVEEPKLNAKEIQEIEAQRLQLDTERKAFQEERQRIETEFQEKFGEKIRMHDELDAFISDLETTDPDLFAVIKSSFGQYAKQFNNPVIAELRKQQEGLKAELDQFKSNATAEVTLAKLDTDLKKLQDSLGKEAEAAGVKLDLNKVKEVWASNPKLSPEQAAWVAYGPSLYKAAASKAKVSASEKKVAARPAVKTAGSMQASKGNTGTDFSKMSTREIVEWEARQLKRA